MRMGTGSGPTRPVHLIDWHCGTIKQVTRSTFTSEGLACVAAVDQAVLLATTFHEIDHGPQSIRETQRLIEEAALAYAIEAYVDAMSLIKALNVSNIKIPQEINLYTFSRSSVEFLKVYAQ